MSESNTTKCGANLRVEIGIRPGCVGPENVYCIPVYMYLGNADMSPSQCMGRLSAFPRSIAFPTEAAQEMKFEIATVHDALR